MMTTIAPVIEPGSQNGVPYHPYPNSGYYFTNSQLVTLFCATPGAVIYYTLDNTTPTTSSTLYTAPFTLTETKTVNVIAVKDGMKISPVSSRIFRRVGIIQSASAFRQSDGSLQLSIQTDYSPSGSNYIVRFMDANSNEVFSSYIYSFDTSSGQPVSIYNSPSLALYEKILISYRFNIGTPTNINLPDFEILKSQVIESVLTPVISPANGYYLTSQTVTIVCATDGASIYYTTNGTEPSSTNGTLYTAGFEITTSLMVRAVAYKEGMAKSALASMNYSSNNAVSAPIINPPGGTFSNSFIVTMMPQISDCTIYYTVDGSMPTALSTVYTSAIIVTETTTIKAIALKTGMVNSPIAVATFTKVN